jgi:hypothetical protein
VSLFNVFVVIAAFVAGAIASVAGFGIGSVLTPLLATHLGMKLAVAAVSIPHVLATALRFWMLRRQVDRHVLVSFGITSAIGGLAGAIAHTFFGGRVLTIVLAVLLIFTGITGLLRFQFRFRGATAYGAGALSGFLGGLVGNQGGIRSGAMLGFDVSKEAFVATSTAVGLIVDGARMPVYVRSEGRALLPIAGLIGIAVIGVLAGTLAGRAILGRIPEPVFKRVISSLVLLLGIALFFLPQ